MKKIILSLSAVISVSATSAIAQIKLTDPFGNLKTVQAGTEPWNVQSTTTPATANTQSIFQQGSVGVNLTNADAFSSLGALVVRQESAASSETTLGLPAIKLLHNGTDRLASIEGPQGRVLRLITDNNDYAEDGVEITLKNTQANGIDATNALYNTTPGVTLPASGNGVPYTIFKTYPNGRIAINQIQTAKRSRVATDPADAYPTEALDIVQGNARIRGLKKYDNTIATQPIVADATGVLGRRATSAVVSIVDHPASGLRFNTRDGSTGADGAQAQFPSYVIFGSQKDAGDTNGGWTAAATTFAASEGEVLNINANIVMKVFQNFSNQAELTSTSTGDRQIILTMELYKGTTKLRSSKRVVSFTGPGTDTGSGTWDPNFRETLTDFYKVPTGASATDYSVTVKVKLYAPDNGNFRISFLSSDNDGGLQSLIVTKL